MTPLRTVFGCDLRTLALFRIGLGVAFLADLINRGRDLRAHYTYWGVVPQPTATDWVITAWVHQLIGSMWFEVGVFLFAGLVALALVVGYKTRVTTVMGWFLLMFIQTRNPLVLTGGGNLLLFLFFWSMFLPLGARYSVDSAVDPIPSDFSNAYFSMGTVAILLQVSCLYFFSALQKSASSSWFPDGTILHYVFHAQGWVLPAGEWLLDFPGLLQVLAYSVLILELIGPLLWFSPWFHLPLRISMLVMFVMLHLGILTCINVGLFPLNNFVSLLLFIPAWFWERLTNMLPTSNRGHFTMYFDGDCEFCRKICLLFKTFLLLPNVPVVPAQERLEIFHIMEERNTWVVQDQNGLSYTHWDAVIFLVRHSPIWWPFAGILKVSLLQSLGGRLYKVIARNRGRLSRLTHFVLPYLHRERHSSVFMEGVVGVLAVYLVFINFSNLPNLPFHISDPFAIVKKTLRINQKWHMFSSPRKWSIWYVIPGRLIDGTDVDVYNFQHQTPSLENTSFEQSPFPNHRWRKYFEKLLRKQYLGHIKHYAAYLCRAWNEVHPPLQHLLGFEIYYILEHHPPPFERFDGNERRQEKHRIWRQSCLKNSP